MTGPWIVAFAVLCCVVLVLVLVLAIFQLGLFAKIDRLVAQTDAEPHEHVYLGGLRVGEEVPLSEFNDDEFNDDEFDAPLRFDNAIVLFTAQGCSPCEVLLDDLIRHPVVAEDRAQLVIWDGDGNAPDAPGWHVVTRHVATIRRLMRIDSTPFGLVTDEAAVVLAAGVPNSARDVMRLLKKAAARTQASEDAAAAPAVVNS